MNRSFGLATAFALLTVACGGGGGAGKGAEGASNGSEHPLVGAPAPEFDLKAQYGGSRASLGDSSGKVRIVDFWATWCEPCRESFPAYQKLQEKHGDDLVIIGLSVDDEPDGIKAFAKDTGVKFVLAWDEGQQISARYEPPTMPTSYLVDKKGIVRNVHAGFRAGDEQEVEREVTKLLE